MAAVAPLADALEIIEVLAIWSSTGICVSNPPKSHLTLCERSDPWPFEGTCYPEYYHKCQGVGIIDEIVTLVSYVMYNHLVNPS